MSFFACVDIEAYEHSKSKILEVGISIVDLEEETISTRHFIVEENMSFRNGKYVADNRDNFSYGLSEVVSQKDLVAYLDIVISVSEGIVGHALSNDTKYLHNLGVTEHNDAQKYDTQTVAKEFFKNQRTLEAVFEHYCGDKEVLFHNAGNDSHATAMVFLAQHAKSLIKL